MEGYLVVFFNGYVLQFLQLICLTFIYTVSLYLEPNSAPKNAGIVQNSVSTQRAAPFKAATLEAVSDLNVHCKYYIDKTSYQYILYSSFHIYTFSYIAG